MPRQLKILIPLAIGLIAGVFLVALWLTTSRHHTSPVLLPPNDRTAFDTDIVLPTLQGPMMRLADFQGHVILLNFWATWCYPCREEMPSMNALYQRYRNEAFTIIAIASDVQGRTDVEPYVKQQNLIFPVLLDPHNTIGMRLQLQGIPTSYLLDRQGRIASIQIGARDWNGPRMQRLIDPLLKEADGP